MGDHGIGEVVFLKGDAGHAGEDAGNLAGIAEPAALGLPLLAVLDDLVGVARAGVVAHLVELAGLAGALVGELRPADGVMRIAPVGQVGDVLAALGLAADTELLENPTVHGDGVAAGVAEDDHGVGFGDGAADVGFLEDQALGDLNALVVFAGVTVGDEYRAFEGGVVVAVADRAFHLVLGNRHVVKSVVGEGAVIYHVGIAAASLYFFDNGGDVLRPEDGGPVVFAVVDLDGHLVPFAMHSLSLAS